MLKTILKTLVMGWLAKRFAGKAHRPKGWKKAYRRGYGPHGYGPGGYGQGGYGPAGYGHRPRGLKGLLVEALLHRLRR